MDPEGDYDEIERAVPFGDADSPPVFDSVLDLLTDRSQNATVNLLGVPLRERPAAVGALLPRLQELRTKTGRPNWIVIDEAHHVLPHLGGRSATVLPDDPAGMAFITVHPDHVAPRMLSRIDLLVVTDDVERALGGFAEAADTSEPSFRGSFEPKEQAVAWFAGSDRPPTVFTPVRARQELQRHVRKYARGDMAEDAFVFCGPDGKLNLKAQNLELFV